MPTFRLAHGYHLPHEVTEFEEQCLALLRINPDETLVVGTSAAFLHGMWLPVEPRSPEFATAEAGRPALRMRRSRRPQFVTHRRQIPLSHRSIVMGVPVTSLARTWWDLAASLSLPDLVAAGDRALQLGTTRDELAEIGTQLSRHRGVVRARTALGYLNERSCSRPESHLRVAIEEAGLHCFAVNEPIHDRYGGWLAEPDLSCSEARIALEYQGSEHAELVRMRKDITRLTDLRHNDWLTLQYGPAQVFGRPWLIAPEVRNLLLRRAPELLRPTRGPR